MIIVLIRTVFRKDVDSQEYAAVSARMNELVKEMPGFISIKGYTAEDGDEVSIARFESEEALAAWRNHPEHLEAQRAGRERFFSSYDVQVCTVARAYDFAL